MVKNARFPQRRQGGSVRAIGGMRQVVPWHKMGQPAALRHE